MKPLYNRPITATIRAAAITLLAAGSLSAARAQDSPPVGGEDVIPPVPVASNSQPAQSKSAPASNSKLPGQETKTANSGTSADTVATVAPAVNAAIDAAATIPAQYIPANAPPASFTWPLPTSPRVNADIKGKSLRDALKKLFAGTGQRFEIDKDVPDSLTISLKATNVRLNSVVTVITEALGIGAHLSADPGMALPGTTKPIAQTGSVYHFTKKLGIPPYWGAQSDSLPYSYLYYNDSLMQAKQYLERALDKQRMLKDSLVAKDAAAPVATPTRPSEDDGALISLPAGVSRDVQIATKRAHDDANLQVTKALESVLTQKPLVYDITTTEARSTFTCPSCKEQITVLRKHTAPKCPTCGKDFQKEWKFCPNDGAKRPAEAGDWKFCPHCGKAVSH